MPRGEIRSEVISTPEVAGSTALIASAKNLTMKRNGKRRAEGDGVKIPNSDAWQDDCWYFYDLIGEYRYACDWVGNLISKAILHVVETPKGKPTKNKDALEIMGALYGGVEGQQQMLREIGVQLTVAGETYIIAEEVSKDEPEQWQICAPSALKVNGTQFTVDGEPLAGSPLVMRLWKPHARKPKRPNSPSRAALPILAQILQMTKYVSAQADSRLAGAGILALPSEISFPTRQMPTDQSGDPADAAPVGDSASAFVAELTEIMSLAIADREDASSLVPIIVQAAGEHLDKIRHIKFWSELDAQAAVNIENALRRLALAMDMPPEILMGTGDVNHWGAWQIEEAAIKAHTEPLLAVITDSLTVGYLRPQLRASGMSAEEAEGYAIWADTSKLRLRPNRSKEALELYDRGELSGSAVLRENGFEPSDAMDEKERVTWFVRKVAQGSTTPELVAAALAILGVPVPVEAIAVDEEPEMQEARPTRSLEEHPKRGAPNDDEVPTEVAAAAEGLVFRALERAGNKLKNKLGRARPEAVDAVDLYRFANVTEAELDGLLDDAFSLAGRLTAFSYCERETLTAGLDSYVRTLLVSGTEYDRDVMCRHIALAKGAAA